MAFIELSKDSYPLYFILPGEVKWLEFFILTRELFEPEEALEITNEFLSGCWRAFQAENDQEEASIQRWFYLTKLCLIPITEAKLLELIESNND